MSSQILFKSFFSRFSCVFAIFIFGILVGHKSQAQMGYKSFGQLFNNNGVTIELKIKMSKNPCSQMASDNQFILDMQGVNNVYGGQGYFLKWRMRVIQCNGDILEKNFTINLDNNNQEGNNESQDWSFPGERIEGTFDRVRVEQDPNIEKDLLIKNIKSQPPTKIEGNLLLMTGESTTLSVSSDGRLGTNCEWYWYKGQCVGTPIGKGPSIKITPDSAGTYSVRAEGKTDTSASISAFVEVDDDSKPPTKIIGPDRLCSGAQKKVSLEVYGGKLGYNANWVWYEDACGSIKLGIGKTLSVAPSKTTTYYVRAEGQTNTTNCAILTIYVSEKSEDPIQIIGKSVICQGESVTLAVAGGKLSAGANWVWYDGNVNQGKRKGEGVSLVVSPTSTSTYFVRAEGPCNTTNPISFQVYVNTISKLPSYIQVTKVKNRQYTLSAINGYLGDNSKWVWYKDKCGSDAIGEGASISYRASKSNAVFVRARGGCQDPAFCTSSTFTYTREKKQNELFTAFFNIGVQLVDRKVDGDNFVFTLGSRKVYLRGKIGSKMNADGTKINPAYTCNDVAVLDFPPSTTSFYQFNGESYNRRTSITAGFMMGGNIRLYFGGGYGSFRPLRGLDIKSNQGNVLLSKQWASNITRSATGLEGEAGLFINIKGFNIMGGMNIIYDSKTKRQHIDASIGIGISAKTD